MARKRLLVLATSGSTLIVIIALGGWPGLTGAALPSLVPIPTVTAQSNDPLSLLNSWTAARNAGDIDRAVAMVTEDFARTIGTGLSFSGPAGERSFLEATASSGTRIQVQNPHVTGDRVTYTAWERNAYWTKFGIGAMALRVVLVAQGGKIRSVDSYYLPESIARLRGACDTPQAQGVRLYNRWSCSEYVQVAEAQTRKVAVTLKPFSAETNYTSLQGFLRPLSNP